MKSAVLACLSKGYGQPPSGRFKFVKLVDQRFDLRSVFLAIYFREENDLPIQVDRYFFGS